MTIPRNLSFLAQGASATGVLSVSYGGTGLTTLTAGYIPYGNGTSAFASSAGLFFDGNNLGIGTSSPANKLNIVGDNVAYRGQLSLQTSSANNYAQITFYDRTTLQAQIYQDYGAQTFNIVNVAATPMLFWTSNTERMRISASGGVSIGNTTDPGATNLSVTGNIGSGVALSTWSAGKVAQIGNSGGTASVWADGSGDSYLINNAYYNAGWKYQVTGYNANYYILQNNGDHAWFSAPSGTAGNAITFTQAMTLNNSGNLLVGGTTNPSIGGAGQMIHALSSGINGIGVTQSTSGGICFVTNAANNGGTYYHMYFTDAGTSHGSITSNGTITTYSTTSDARLKENIVDAPSGNIDAIKVRSFDWKSNGSHQTYGMVAQELIEAAPYAVTIGIDEEKIMQVDYSTLVPMMIKEIQDLKARIATLEAK